MADAFIGLVEDACAWHGCDCKKSRSLDAGGLWKRRAKKEAQPHGVWSFGIPVFVFVLPKFQFLPN